MQDLAQISPYILITTIRSEQSRGLVAAHRASSNREGQQQLTTALHWNQLAATG
jgi:hypothetical protein